MSELKNGFLTAEEVMDILQVKQSKAYQIIRQLNKELSGMGLITVPGRVDANYFKKKLFYEEKYEVLKMAVYQEKDKGTWRVVFRYTDFTGERKQTQKRGFKTKREATAWEHEMMLRKGNKLDMTFESFYEIYSEYKRQRVKKSTFETKSHIVRTKILPYFGKRKINEITVADVIAWQNEMMAYRDEKGKPYSVDYLKTIQAQLTAIFNHAVNYYNLPSNPARQAGSMGKEVPKEMKFWTKEQYLKFAEAMMDKPRSYYAFEMLYWTGIREGELLALTPADFDFEKQTVRINKTYHRMKKQDIITSPKTAKSNRIVVMPEFLCEEMQDYFQMYYSLAPDQRIFPFSKSYLKHEMERGCKETGVPIIRIHDLRHSHVSLLIHMGFTALAIGNRVGHEAEKITYRYAHLFPTVQTEMANKLDMERMEKEDEI